MGANIDADFQTANNVTAAFVVHKGTVSTVELEPGDSVYKETIRPSTVLRA